VRIFLLQLTALAAILGAAMVLVTPAEVRAVEAPLAPAAEASSGGTQSIAKPQPIVIGSDVPKFSELASRVGQGLMWVGFGIFIVIALLKRFGPNRMQALSPIEVLGRQTIGPKMQISIIKVEGRKFLISSTATDLRLLTELVPPAESEEFNKFLMNEQLQTALIGNSRT